MSKPFEKNLEDEIHASLSLAEAPNRKLIIVAVYSEPPEGDAEAQGGLCRAVSAGTTKRDARVFIVGLRREADRKSVV